MSERPEHTVERVAWALLRSDCNGSEDEVRRVMQGRLFPSDRADALRRAKAAIQAMQESDA